MSQMVLSLGRFNQAAFGCHLLSSVPEGEEPYAIAMKDGSTFALAAIWETWRNLETGDEVRTFAVITCPANEMMATIHNRIPVILHPGDYERWLSDDPDPSDLMTMWPIDRKAGSPRNNTPDIFDPIEPELF